MNKLIWMDVSRYQNQTDYDELYRAGVYGLIIKASQGSIHRDIMLDQHVAGAIGAGLRYGLYHWFDPTILVSYQVGNFLKRAAECPGYDFLAVDVEQFWQSWQEYLTHNIKKIIPAATISGTAYKMASELRKQVHCPVLVYTRTSFIQSWAPDMVGWLASGYYPLWLAAWPYTKTRVTVSWEEFRAKHLPKSEPKLPQQYDAWTFWQFTGDKFILPGNPGAVDVNWFNGDEAGYLKFLEVGCVEPPPIWLGWKDVVTATARLNVRKQYGDMRVSAIIGKVQKGEKVKVLDRTIYNGNVWAQIKRGWVAEVYSGVRLLV